MLQYIFIACLLITSSCSLFFSFCMESFEPGSQDGALGFFFLHLFFALIAYCFLLAVFFISLPVNSLLAVLALITPITMIVSFFVGNMFFGYLVAYICQIVFIISLFVK
jgi:hypothetical protein